MEQITLNRNTVPVVRYFEWNVIKEDPDDNKCFDCAVAANADFIVSEDKHFNVLRNIHFPHVTVVKVAEFRKMFDAL